MRKAFTLLASLLISVAVMGQNYIPVSAKAIQYAGGQNPPTLLAGGELCFLGTDANDTPIAFQPGGSGQVVSLAACTPIANGAIFGFSIANPALTTPQNIRYRITITGPYGHGLLYSCPNVAVAAPSFNFDTLVCSNQTIPPTPSGPESLGQKLRRLAAAAAVGNSLVNSPLSPPAAWQGSVAYTYGAVVSNGGNLYICQTAGTSAGSGGPTGTGAAGITDGGVTWFFYGVSSITTASPLAPTLTYAASAPAGLTLAFNAQASPSLFAFSGGRQVNYFTAVSLWSNTVPGTGNLSAACTNCNGSYQSYSFKTDAPKFWVSLSTSTDVRFLVDDHYVSLSFSHVAVGGTGGITFDFSNAGGRAVRTITMESGLATGIVGVYVDPASKVWAPAQDSPILMVQGDSFAGGAGGFPFYRQDWPTEVGKLLGISNTVNVAQGGTGYIAAGTTYSIPNRTTRDVCPQSPNVLIDEGGINESGQPAANIQAAVLTTLQGQRACLPYAVIVVIGIPFGTSGPSAANIAAENAIAAGVAQFIAQTNDPLTFFIRVSTDPNGAWFTGTGTIGSPVGSGNNDVCIINQPHPQQACIDRFAARLSNAIRTQVLPSIP